MVATEVGAIPEVIVDGATGRLVPPDDPAALAAALAGLIGDPALRAPARARGARRVLERFGMAAGLDRLAARFGASQGPGRRVAA